MTRLDKLRLMVSGVGLDVHTANMGDGKTRYRFGRGDCYYSMKYVYTAVGYQQASLCAVAYVAGYFEGRQPLI